ncbi:MAG: type II and III secretion system protein family protein, partial [Rhodospirillales bacterium]|nr:type II and III secretion system protein family protein [Rhodospirillales bacterium]
MKMLPEEAIEVSALGTSVILAGTVRTPRAAEDARLMAARHVGDPEAVINRIKIAQVQQVSLRVRVAEVQRTIMKDLNLNGAIGTHRAAPSAGTTNTFFSTIGLTKGGGQAASGIGRLGGNIGLAMASGGFLGGAALLMDALESDGLIRTLAEPTLTSMSGEEARFLAGGEFPVPTGVDNNGRVKIEFKEFGVSLAFRPVVLDDGRINLNVATEVSEIDDANAIILSDLRIPALKTRRASTTVELPSGAALVIGGLLQNDYKNVIDGFPGLRNIPILGALFRSVDFQRQETELVITVTPYLVEPFNDNDVVLPTDGYVPPNDLEMYLLGKLQVAYGRKEGEVPDGKPAGPIGYIVK